MMVAKVFSPPFHVITEFINLAFMNERIHWSEVSKPRRLLVGDAEEKVSGRDGNPRQGFLKFDLLAEF